MKVKVLHQTSDSKASSDIFIDARNLDKAIRHLRFPLHVLTKIRAQALSKTARWASRRAIAEVAKSVKIPTKFIRPRVRKSDVDDGCVKIWIGLKKIGLDKLNPKKTASGIRVGPVTVPGGFFGSGNAGKPTRYGKTTVDAMDRGSKFVFKRAGKSRLPIKRQFLHLYEPAQAELTKLAGEIGEYLQERFNEIYEVATYK